MSTPPPARRPVVRVVTAAAAVTLAAVLGACSTSKGSLGSASVNGGVGSQPVVSVKGKPPETTQVDVVTRGSGATVAAGDLVVADDYARTWTDAAPFQDTFASNTPPDSLPVGTGAIPMQGLDGALVGVTVGSRVLVVIPPKEGFGEVSSGLPSGVTTSDTAVFVFDVLASYPANSGPSGTPVTVSDASLPTVSETDLHAKPTITIPTTDPPTKLSVTTLVQGAGPAVAKGQEVVVQYTGEIWASGKEFDSTWSRGVPSVFTAGDGQLIQAWDQGLIGVKVGSRVLIIAPPDAAYGSQGLGDAGITPTDTLVFVIDVLGAYGG